jgi:Holliday junction resolvasome RuvABC endonuclease subunit
VIVIGLDLSYSCTAGVMLAVRDGEGPEGEVLTVRTTKERFSAHPGRLVHIRDRVVGFCASHEPALVAIEGYAYGTKQGREAAGELGGQVKVGLWEIRLPYIVVAPTTLKAFVLGSGRGEKSHMMLKVFQRWGFEAANDDQADAYGLARFAEAYLQPRSAWTKRFAQLARKVEIVQPARLAAARAS